MDIFDYVLIGLWVQVLALLVRLIFPTIDYLIIALLDYIKIRTPKIDIDINKDSEVKTPYKER